MKAALYRPDMAGVAALYLFFLIQKVSPLFKVSGNISKPVQVGRPMTLSCNANQVGSKLEKLGFCPIHPDLVQNWKFSHPPQLQNKRTCLMSRTHISYGNWLARPLLRNLGFEANPILVFNLYKVFSFKAIREGVKKPFFLGLCPKLWVGGGPKSQTF